MSKTKKNDDANKARPTETEMGRVIPFPQRNGGRRGPEPQAGRFDATPSPLRPEALGRERTGRPEPDDYRHRMLVNASAFALCAVLVVAGVWMATTMAELRQRQDCVLSGRTNCGPVAVPIHRERRPN